MKDARYKVKEAVEMVEKTYSEKDALKNDLKKSNGKYNLSNFKMHVVTVWILINIIQITLILEKIVNLEKELTNLIQESGTKISLEAEKVKTMYKDKLREANVEIEFLRTVRIIIIPKKYLH